MRNRSLGLSLIASVALVATACSSGGGGTPGPTPTPNPCAGAAAHSGAKHVLPTDKTKLKIGVATDVGTINDKNFNEYTYQGAKDAAAALGAAVPAYVVPKTGADNIPDIQSFVDQGYDIIVTAGFANGTATTCEAAVNPDIWFIGIDQGPGPSPALANYMAVDYQEDQAGYLAGMIAASVSKTGTIGAIGGITLCGPCVRYIQGYELGAASINPAIVVKTDYVTTSDFTKAFNDPVSGKAFGKQFLSQNSAVDVLFQVAGKTGNGILDAACEANIYGVGVDVDQYLSYPNAAKCTVTSAEKKLAASVAFDINAILAGTAKGGEDHWDASRDGIGYSPFHDLASIVPATLQAKLDAALAAMKAGTLKTCPSKATGDKVDCGNLQ
jgi:basic membrane protein A